MIPKIFIDGAEGTTGIVIADLLKPLARAGKVELISVDDHRSEAQRRRAYEQADLTVLCLPDDAAREAMKLMEGTKTRVLDASTAHRVDEDWVYGLPELNAVQPELIRNAQYVSNPGCFATGAIALLRPLIDAGLLDEKEAVTLVGVTGYSAAGKKAIDRHLQAGDMERMTDIFAAVSLNAPHKHIPEIQKHSGLATTPILLPHMVDVERGMMVSAAFNRASLRGGLAEVQAAYEAAYAGAPAVQVHPQGETNRLDFSPFQGMNASPFTPPLETLGIHVSGWEEGNASQVRVTAQLDNLGKGAGTQAVQNIRLMLGI